MSKISALLDTLNALLVERDLPRLLPYVVTDDGTTTDVIDRTVADLERQIYEVENPPVGVTHPPPPSTPALLARLNLARAQNDMPPLAMWKSSRLQLSTTIARLERTSTHVTPTRCPTRVAPGANSKMPRRNKLHEAIKKERRQEERALAGDKPSRKAPTNARASDFLTPTNIAQLLSLAPRNVRMFLRSHEKEIPAAHRDPSSRWAFHTHHQPAILAWIKKGMKK